MKTVSILSTNASERLILPAFDSHDYLIDSLGYGEVGPSGPEEKSAIRLDVVLVAGRDSNGEPDSYDFVGLYIADTDVNPIDYSLGRPVQGYFDLTGKTGWMQYL